MRCFIGFFGITRSLRLTAQSIHDSVYAPLEQAGLTVLRAGHFNLPAVISNERSGEAGIVPDRDEASLLHLDLCWLEQQDNTAIGLELDVATALPDRLGDAHRSLGNLCHQLRSLRQLWSLLRLQGVTKDDLVLLLRPDLLYLDPIRPMIDLAPLLEGRADVIVPGWQSWGGMNDRLAFCSAHGAEAYANRFDSFLDGCIALDGMHPESFLALTMQRAGVSVAHTGLRAVRVRADGTVPGNDLSMLRASPLAAAPINADAAQVAADASLNRPTVALESVTRALAASSPDAPVPVPLRHATQAVRTARKQMTRDGYARTTPLGGIHYLQFLHHLHRRHHVSRYFEIGTQTGRSLSAAAHRAVAIDPRFLLDKQAWAARPGIQLFEMTSDAFFAAHDPAGLLGGPVELAFIDGMHLSEYVLRDFINVERSCTPNSLIVLHDALPQNFEMTERDRCPTARTDKALAAAWTGDVWRVVPVLQERRPDLEITVLDCPPTGLVLIGNPDPTSHVLENSLEDITETLVTQAPSEAEFWSFIEGLPVSDSRSFFPPQAA